MKQTLMNFKSIACFKGPLQRKQRDSRMGFSFKEASAARGFFWNRLELVEVAGPGQVNHHDHEITKRESEASEEFITDPEIETELEGDDQIQQTGQEEPGRPAQR